MQGMDLFLFPSLFEGLPVVLVEAQAAGLKCVVSDRITKETDITGRIVFESLSASPRMGERNPVLNYEHEDTCKRLSEKGYDTKKMAQWLTELLFENSIAEYSSGKVVDLWHQL